MNRSMDYTQRHSVFEIENINPYKAKSHFRSTLMWTK